MKHSEKFTKLKLRWLYYTHVGRTLLLAKTTINMLKRFGVRYTGQKTYQFIKKRVTHEQTNAEWFHKHKATPEQLELQRRTQFKNEILFSIIVPLYNTPERSLQEMFESVKAQTYAHWELCLADGSDSSHAYVEEICEKYALADHRVLYRKLPENLGISGNTNACLELASGEFVALLDHDDVLMPAALYEMMQVLDNKDADVIYTDEATFLSPDLTRIRSVILKPDFGIDNLRANNYMCHFTAFRRSLLSKAGGYRSVYDGSQDHDMMLRLATAAEHNKIVHVPKVLYLWRAFPGSTALNVQVKSSAPAAGRDAVADHLKAVGLNAQVECTDLAPTIYRIHYEITGNPLISIVIPTSDKVQYLRRCLESIRNKTTYSRYEIILVENNSKEAETFSYYEEVTEKWENVKLLRWHGGWNWSAINNYAVKEAAKGEYILLLNNDTEVITPDWIEEMLMYVQRDDVGAAGAMLLYRDRKIQHAGVILGLGGVVAGHAFHHTMCGETGYMGRKIYAQNLSAVTGACMMIKRKVWEQIHGIDEQFAEHWNDVDLCLRIRKAGYLIVWTPYAELFHHESCTRGYNDTPQKIKEVYKAAKQFWERWADDYAEGDPYYNPNLSLMHSDFKKKYNW